MIQAGLGTKNDCAGEDQQQFTPPTQTHREKGDFISLLDTTLTAYKTKTLWGTHIHIDGKVMS
jgi:hypothetical protein